MKKIIAMIASALVLLPGCKSADKESAGIQRCTPKPGFENTFPTFEYDANDPEFNIVIDLALGPQEITFRDRISGKLMTVGAELHRYYNCEKIG